MFMYIINLLVHIITISVFVIFMYKSRKHILDTNSSTKTNLTSIQESIVISDNEDVRDFTMFQISYSYFLVNKIVLLLFDFLDD